MTAFHTVIPACCQQLTRDSTTMWPSVPEQRLQTPAIAQSMESDKSISYLFYRKRPNLDTNGSIRTIQNRICTTAGFVRVHVPIVLKRREKLYVTHCRSLFVGLKWSEVPWETSGFQNSWGTFPVIRHRFRHVQSAYGDLKMDRKEEKSRL
jgi:hypothetical protein